MSKHPPATPDSILKAYRKALKTVSTDDRVSKSSSSAGFIIPDRQLRGAPKSGYQVFVTVVEYSEAKLKEFPESGGLLVAL
jgi:hypothetical protein